MDDLQIIELYQNRDERAIQETALKYGKLCFSIANNILGNEEDSEECVNDTYLSMWKLIPNTKPNNFLALICKITRNLSLKRLDFNNALKRNPNSAVSFSDLEDVLSDGRINPDIADEELGRIISDFLRSQKEDVRNVFIRKYWFFDSVCDIAKRYSFSESKVKSMLYHTRVKLKKYLQKEGIEI